MGGEGRSYLRDLPNEPERLRSDSFAVESREGKAHAEEYSVYDNGPLLSWRSMTGSVKKNVVPTPSSDSNWRYPPSCSTSSRQMYRPSPVPLIPHARALSARMKRPKICAC